MKMIRPVMTMDDDDDDDDEPIVELHEEHKLTLEYLPVCDWWPKSRCKYLGLNFVRSNQHHTQTPESCSIYKVPKATYRMKADGNCFFRALAQAITGSQDNRVSRLSC